MGTLWDGYFGDGAYWIMYILSYWHIVGWIFWGWGILDYVYFELWAHCGMDILGMGHIGLRIF